MRFLFELLKKIQIKHAEMHIFQLKLLKVFQQLLLIDSSRFYDLHLLLEILCFKEVGQVLVHFKVLV